MADRETFLLISGRASRPPTTLKVGTIEETGTLSMNPADMARLKLADGDRVRLTTEQGKIELPCQVAPAGELPPGLLFLPYGIQSNRLMGGETHATGMPDSKSFDVGLEKV